MYTQWIQSISFSHGIEAKLADSNQMFIDDLHEGIADLVANLGGEYAPSEIARHSLGQDIVLCYATISPRSAKTLQAGIERLPNVLSAVVYPAMGGGGGGPAIYLLPTGSPLIPSSHPDDPYGY